MKAGGLRIALQTAVLAVLIPAAGFADEVKEKLEYCKNCHGNQAQGFQGYYTAPRLAGQPVQYLENQFEALAKHRRDNPIAQQFMWPGIEGVPQGLRAAIAKQFNELNPPPADGGPGISYQLAKISTIKVSLTRTCPHAPSATARMRMAMIRCHAWQARCMLTRLSNWPGGARDTEQKIRYPPARQTPCSQLLPA